ncbi:MAG: hypothetical protein QOF69_1725 [Solirubrobacteraceae bacterium]|nr:hypothetical protein [Solirubrobacteraceae bacterium]
MRGWRLYGARAAALAALCGGAVYLTWRFGQLSELGVLATIFFIAELVNYLALLEGVVLFWRPRNRLLAPPPPDGTTLDVLVPVCGEDVDMIEATVRAALAIDYPHETIVLNDGHLAGKDNWWDVELLCERLGVRCLTRTVGNRGKAGNLNAALPLTSGEFIVVLDADHIARPDLAQLLLGHFDDPRLAFVTSQQCFQLDRHDLLGHQQAFFYRLIQPAKDRDNAAFSCGNGVAYRRAAIDSIGGFSEWNLVEDLTTSYELHARGWHSAYVAIPVSVGTAPSTAAELASQRLRWATDSLRLFFWDNPLFKKGLTLRQKLHYAHTTGWYLVGAIDVIYLISPIVAILTGARLIAPGSEWTYAGLIGLYLLPIALMLTAYVGWRGAARSAQLQLFLAPVFAVAIVRALFAHPRRMTRRLQGGVTAKRSQRKVSWLTTFHHTVLALLLVSVGIAIMRPGVTLAVVLWACVLATALATPGSMLGLGRDMSQTLRIAISAPAVAAALLVALTVWSAYSIDSRSSQAAAAAPAAAEATAAGKTAGPTLGPPKRGVYLGTYNPTVAGSPRKPLSLIRYPGSRMAIFHRFQAWWGRDRFMAKEWMAAVKRRRAVPMITWEPWRKPVGEAASPNQRRGLLRQIANGRYDLFVRRWARDAKAYGKPMLLRFMHEMNGRWYPWGVGINGNTPAAYKAAWRRVWMIFRREGATNVGWVFSVESFAGGPPTTRSQYDAYYPGARYVDWVGMSGFNWGFKSFGGWLSFDRVFGRAYDVVKTFNKPIMLGEVGVAAGDPRTAGWVRDALRSAPKRFPRIKAMVWYDWRHPQRDFRLHGKALRELRTASRAAELRPAVRLMVRRR